MKTKRLEKHQSLLTGTVAVFLCSAFLLLALRDFRPEAFLMAMLVPGLYFASTRIIPRLFPADELVLFLVNSLCALGVLVLYRMDPQVGIQQAVNYLIGLFAMVMLIVLVRIISHWAIVAAVSVILSFALMALPLLFGREINGAQAWVTMFGIGFQPSELVKVLLLVTEAYLLARRKLLIAIVYAGVCLFLLMLQKDLGTALIYYGVTLILLFAATRNYLLLGMGVAGALAGGYAGYMMFSHVKRRVAIWIDPWYDYNGSGYQIVQSLIAMANGGLWGTGLTLGTATGIPASTTDFIFPVLLNEFGLLFGFCVLALYLVLFLRGIGVAMRSNSRFHTLLALGASAIIALQTFVIIGGNIKLIPLTGVTLPFISYGGTSLLSSMCIMGVLQGVASINKDEVLADRELALMQEEYI